MRPCSPVIALVLLATSSAAFGKSASVNEIAKSRAFAAARQSLEAGHERFVEEIIRLTEIPAPPFKEAARAAAMAARFRDVKLTDVAIDPEGNVTGLRAGTDPTAGLIVISAHLDTVFPEGTPIKVRREGSRLYAPGIGDDTRGLAALLAYKQALDAANIKTRHPILFVATVGEEGQGDLRGARYLMTKSAAAGRIAAFYSLDGSNPARVTHAGVGSKRYRVRFTGPGGHSYSAFGIVNPMAAMAGTIAGLYKIVPPTDPKTTYSASVTGGGTSVNSIPSDVFFEVDMRSEKAGALADLDARFRALVAQAVDAENAARSTKNGKVAAVLEVIGERPAGATPRDSAIVEATAAAITTLGFTPEYLSASTDANVAMGLGVPAITMGSGGGAERAHSVDEFIDVAQPASARGLAVGLLSLLATAGMVLP